MCPYFTLGPLTLPSYWVLSLVGVAAACLLLWYRWRRQFPRLDFIDVTNLVPLGSVGAIVGGKLLYLLTILPLLWQYRAQLAEDVDLLLDSLNGLVFYGGLFGGLFAVYLYAKKYKMNRPYLYDCLAPCLPLYHGIARIGCFLTGCCHGIESSRFGIAFTESRSALNGIPYFPIQLVEAAAELLLCLVVLAYEKRHHAQGNALKVYLVLYSILRFFVEFFRGDAVRGIWGAFSTSQWISLAIMVWAGLRFVRQRRAASSNP